MKIYAVTSPSVNWLYDSVFLPSILKVEPTAKVITFESDIGGNGDFSSPEFIHIQLFRLELILAWIKDNFGEVILVSDIDIRYLRPFVKAMNDEIRGYDLAFQQHGNSANIGQMFIRCTPDTLIFYEMVLSETRRTGEWEEVVLNKTLHNTFNGRYKLLSPQFANTKVGFMREMYSFHPIGTVPRPGASSRDLKIQQFEALDQYLSSLKIADTAQKQ